MSKEDEQQAIHAISAMIAQWWQKHAEAMMRRRPPQQMIMTMPVGVRPRLAHLVPELGKRGSYSATFGPPAFVQLGGSLQDLR